MMNIYITATTSTPRVKISEQISNQLGQKVNLPYFRVFEKKLLTLSDLYKIIDQQIKEIMKKSGWSMNEIKNIPIFLGSTGYVITDCEARLKHNQPLPEKYSIAIIGEYLQKHYQTQVFNFATSCTSSAQGIHYAYKMLKNGMYDKALIIGFELFNRLTFEHFHAMHLLSQENSYQPFIKSNGMVLGEGIACLAISTKPNTKFSCELLGVTTLTDSNNLTNNSETSLYHLLENIIQNAQIEDKNKIRGIKPHAVGGSSDELEKKVLTNILPDIPWILAKPYMGHTLGASGAMETDFLIDVLQQEYAPNLQENNQALPLLHGKPMKDGYYLIYFLGFGGSNVGWIIKWEKY